MKIIKLQAENIKRLSAIEITPDPGESVVKISGKNAQGKTSVLDSIWWALGGASNISGVPIKKGEEKGKITLDLGDLIVERVFTKNGTYVSVTNKDGAGYKSPQQVLNKIISDRTFNPMSFINADAKKQRDILKNIVGLDFSELDMRRANNFEMRTDVNRQLKDLQSQLNKISVPPDAPDEEQTVSELTKSLLAATERNRKHNALDNECLRMERDITDLESKLSEAKAKLEVARKALAELPLVDTSEIEKKISNIELLNNAARLKKQREKLVSRVLETEKSASELTNIIAEIDAEKQSMLSSVKFPVDGLAFNDEGVTYNNLPLDNASFAQKLKIAISIAMAMNPTLRIVLMTDASMLDSENMKIVEDMAKVHDFQIWMEVVDDTGHVGFYIEDGMLGNAVKTAAAG